jgi:hypothetical protein
MKLKEKYWHTEGKQNWVFGVKKDDKLSELDYNFIQKYRSEDM